MLKEILLTGRYVAFFSPPMNGNFPTDETIIGLARFIGPVQQRLTFLHHLDRRDVADQILTHGFEFENHLGTTTDQVNGHDQVELGYIRNIRKAYGDLVLVIQIPDALIHRINSEIQHTQAHFSEALTKNKPVMGDNGFLIFTLPEHYILGYFDMRRSEGIRNPRFDPGRLHAAFEMNMMRIKHHGW